MKKIYLFLLLLSSATAFAQKPEIRINANAGYAFPDSFDSYYSNTSYYSGRTDGSFQWGVGLEYVLPQKVGVELSYTRQDTKAPTTYADGTIFGLGVQTREFDVAFNYVMLGVTKYFPVNPTVEPYFGMQGGVAIVDVSNPVNANGGSVSRFGWAIKGGSNFWVAPKVGIKLQAGLNSVTQAAGGGLYFGTGGVGTGVSTYSTIYQFALGAGLVFKI
ncbi:outer membrane beta-barrel protein [Pedobacter sp. MW01-1-1]|uniref:outer membrane beta-barrel protein n=1 Tax=Pedobacter sp. MW01-1-1 TaxID=3383027 RepID=UPI003FF00A83